MIKSLETKVKRNNKRSCNVWVAKDKIIRYDSNLQIFIKLSHPKSGRPLLYWKQEEDKDYLVKIKRNKIHNEFYEEFPNRKSWKVMGRFAYYSSRVLLTGGFQMEAE